MISDNDLYRLALFLGTCAMLMIVLYHFLEVNAQDDDIDQPHSGQGQKNARAASGSNITKPENMAVSEDGVPLAAVAAAAGGSAVGGKGR